MNQTFCALRLVAAWLVLILPASVANAATLTVDGAALYCESSVDAIRDGLKGLNGFSDLKVDVDARRITLSVGSESQAKEVVAALARAGFHGSARFGDKAVPFPDSGVKPGLKLGLVVLTGPYLGCSASVTKLHAAVQAVESVDAVDIDRNARTIRLTGKDVDVGKAAGAINAAGFHVQLPPVKPK